MQVSRLSIGNERLFEARATKTPDEILCFRQVAALAEAGWYAEYDTIRPGFTQKQVMAAAVKALYDVGFDDPVEVVVWSGAITFERGWCNTDQIIRVGDIVFSDIHNAAWMGYHLCHSPLIYRGQKAKPTRDKIIRIGILTIV